MNDEKKGRVGGIGGCSCLLGVRDRREAIAMVGKRTRTSHRRRSSFFAFSACGGTDCLWVRVSLSFSSLCGAAVAYVCVCVALSLSLLSSLRSPFSLSTLLPCLHLFFCSVGCASLVWFFVCVYGVSASPSSV